MVRWNKFYTFVIVLFMFLFVPFAIFTWYAFPPIAATFNLNYAMQTGIYWILMFVIWIALGIPLYKVYKKFMK